MDDVVLNKIATIERCLLRVKEEYNEDKIDFLQNQTRQDAALLNIQRACEACLDIGQRIIRLKQLGIPQSARDVFTILAEHHWISAQLAKKLGNMVGFRNIIVHDYQKIQLDIVIAVIEQHLGDFLELTQAVLQHTD